MIDIAELLAENGQKMGLMILMIVKTILVEGILPVVILTD